MSNTCTNVKKEDLCAVQCTAANPYAIGGGATLDNGLAGGEGLDMVEPTGGSTSTPATGYRASMSGAGDKHTLKVYAICST